MERPALVYVGPIAVFGVVAVILSGITHLPAGRNLRRAAMESDPVFTLHQAVAVPPFATQLGECDYSAKGLTPRLYECRYKTTASEATVRSYYATELALRGWKIANSHDQFVSWCNGSHQATLQFEGQRPGWTYALGTSVGVPPSYCGS
jgi:hypothetical protein